MHFNRYCEAFVDRFRPLSFPEGFGFDAFEVADVQRYLSDPTVWNFQFKKIPGRGVLYGVSHAVLRRSVLNELPLDQRLSIMGEKFAYFGVLSKLNLLFRDEGICVRDVLDIGMGHSVYRVDVYGADGREMSLVLKQEEWPSQSFFSQLLTVLGLPMSSSDHVMDEKGCWEISLYLGDQTVQDTLLSEPSDFLLEQLAMHAALGDVMGRGDRHFENYLVSDGVLYPIDVSFLFWEGNEHWVRKYIAGGMMEMSALAVYSADMVDFFFEKYKLMLQRLSGDQAAILGVIRRYFGAKDPDTARKLRYVTTRLQVVAGYFEAQRALYLEAFSEMQVRQGYKRRLAALVLSRPDVLEEHPFLKMYFLADKDRLSGFYLVEDGREFLFDLLDELCG